jgi:hypothetical protein
MESIGRGALKTRFVPGSQLKSTGLAKVGFKRILRLVDMVTSDAPCLTSGSGYKNSQRWSRALRAHPSKPDGIYYRSRHDPESGEPSSAAPLEESSTRLPFSSGNRKAA